MNSFELYTSSLARSPSLTGSTSSRSSSPAFPQTPQLEAYQQTNVKSNNSLRPGSSTVLARQQAMLDRSTSSSSLNNSTSNGLSRRGSVQSIKNKTFDSLDADLPTPRASWKPAHASHHSYSGASLYTAGNSFSNLLDDLPSYRTRPTSIDLASSLDYKSIGADYKTIGTDYKSSSAGLQYERPAERLPFTSRSNTLPLTTPASTSAPPTPTFRESRYRPTRTAPLPTENKDNSAPTLSSFRSRTPENYTPYSSALPTSSSTYRSDYKSSDDKPYEPQRSQLPTSVASFSAASRHRHTRSVPSFSEPSTPATAFSSDLSRSQGHSLLPPNGGHGTRHGLDRLSEHYDQESMLTDEATYSPKSPAFSHSRPISFSPPNLADFHTSPDLDAQIERHMPGAARGQVETHKGKGTTNRLVLSRKPTVSSSGLVLPSNSARAMDISRHHLAAFEYLTHVAEAQAWLDNELRKDPDYDASAPEANLTSAGVVDFEQALRNGVALAKLARVFDGRAAVPRIYTAPKLAYAHIDNINHFFNFARKRGLPEVYRFETNDLYNARNIPKVIYCIHALNLFLVSQGQAERMKRIDDLHFSESQLAATKKEIDHLAMPNFKGLTKDIPVEPEPEPETEEERLWRLLDETEGALNGFTSRVRGLLARRRLDARHMRIHRLHRIATPLQSAIRGKLARDSLKTLCQSTQRNGAEMSKVQALARGLLARRRLWSLHQRLEQHDGAITLFQARARGCLARRHFKSIQHSLRTAQNSIVPVQAAVRRLLAGQRLLKHIKSMRGQSDTVSRIQATARKVLAQRKLEQARIHLAHPIVHRSLVNVQSAARAALVRQRVNQQYKELYDATPAMIGFQAVVRGSNARLDYNAWRWHIHNNVETATFLQSLMRGHLARMRFWAMHQHYYSHLEKVVKVQAIFRRKQKRQQYNELTRGKKVPLGTVKNFLHLLQDSDLDYAEEIEVEQLRKQVIQAIRETQALEIEVADLDTKIALMVKNKMSIDDILRGRRPGHKLNGTVNNRQAQDSVLAKHGDTFASNSLDRQSQHRLELYQELFWLLQTKSEYLARLFHQMIGSQASDQERRDVERVVMSLFGYAQNTREEYLLLKLFQRSLHQEILAVNSIDDFIRSDYIFIKLIVQYGRGAKERVYFQDMLSPMVTRIIQDDSIALETDPVAIYNNCIADEEARTGVMSQRQKNISAREALTTEPTFSIFTRNLQHLRALTDGFLDAIFRSTPRMPLGMRWIAREMDRALRAKFPNQPREAVLKVVCHFVYYRYINPAIVAPENVGVQNTVISPSHRRALAEVSKMLNQISAGRLFDANEECLTPLNSYVRNKTVAFSQWLYDVVDVPDAEAFLHADAFIDHVTSVQQAVYISPNEIYLMQRLLKDHVDTITRSDDDRLCQILGELGPPPQYQTDELSRARAGEIALFLTSRHSEANDTHAQDEARLVALMVSTKRMVLSILKIQPGDNLADALNAQVTEEHEHFWHQTRSTRHHQQRLPQSHTSPDLNNLEELDHLSFGQLKYVCMDNLQTLQHAGKLPQDDSTFQEMLDLIAKDIRQKNRKRVQRQTEKSSMLKTSNELKAKLKFLDDQIKSYDAYIAQTQVTMHKQGKKRLTMPFTQQYWHERSMAKKGVHSQFGSYLYTAKKLADDGILLSIDQIDSSRFEQVKVIIRCNQVGAFELLVEAFCQQPEVTKVLYSDLLDAQYNNQESMTIDNTLTVHVNMLLLLIHKKFFA